VRVWTSWLEASIPHFNRGGKLLSFEQLLTWEGNVQQRATLEHLEQQIRNELYRSLLSLERGSSLTVQIRIEKGDV
jgi:hypothetical protein